MRCSFDERWLTKLWEECVLAEPAEYVKYGGKGGVLWRSGAQADDEDLGKRNVGLLRLLAL
jgi:hypothetical protein